MWEEDPRYQQAKFKAILSIVVVGTLIVAGLSFFLGDWHPLRDWLGFLLWFLAPFTLGWLMVVGLVALVVKIAQGLARKRAPKDKVRH